MCYQRPLIVLLMVVGLGMMAACLQASELNEVSPVTDRVVQLCFIDGKAFWNELGQSNAGAYLEAVPLDVKKAAAAENYTLSSSDDPAFAKGLHPQKVGRKTKPRDTMSSGAMQFEHWIYLVLPQAMRDGGHYTVNVGDVSTGAKSLNFVFDTKHARSEVVHVNEVGYVPTAETKRALLSMWMGDLGGLGLDDYVKGQFHVVDAKTGKAVYSGKPTLRKRDKDTGGSPDSGSADEASHFRTDVWECDFSVVRTPGEYVLAMDRVGCSFPFRIDADIYRQAFITSARGVYHQRCGIALKEPYTTYTRGECHRAPKICTSVRYMDHAYSEGLGKDKPKPTGEVRDIWGGYHDAGDWDREGWHPSIPDPLTLVYFIAPQKFKAGELNIPESGNGLPDILNEAQWGVDYYKRLQWPDGGVSVGQYAAGGCKPGTNSATDPMQWYFYAPEPLASFKYAAAACHLAMALEKADKKDLGAPYIKSARLAYDFAKANYHEGDEAKCRDSRLHASAALYQATGEAAFQEAFKKDLLIKTPTDALNDWWSRDQTWGVWTYVLTDRPNIDKVLKKMLIQATTHWADVEYIETAKKRTERMAYPWSWGMSWGHGTLPGNMPLIVAHTVSGDKKYLTAQQINCDNSLGTNPLNMSWVTGLGGRSPKEILLIDSWYMNKPDPVPGMSIAGPFKNVPADTKGAAGDWNWVVAYSHKRVYPSVEQWPLLELFFNNRNCPCPNEPMTGTNAMTAASFGYLCKDQ